MHRKIVDRLNQTQGSILIACHRTPDGDTLGAGLAVFLWLKGLGKQVSIYCSDPVPGVYRFLPGAAEVSSQWGGPHEAVVAVDCASIDRVSADAQVLLSNVNFVVNIDHHATNPFYGTLNHVVADAGSTCELVAEMLFKTNQNVTKDIADCLYTGITTDTGQFAFDYTRPESLRMAALLMERGAAFEEICARVFRRRTLSKTLITTAALNSIGLYRDGKVAVLSVTQAALRSAGSTPDECENIVNYAVEIEGVEVGILLRETQGGDWKVSLRSSGAVNVAAIASGFGGGGHAKAAGCTLKGPLVEAEKQVVDAALAAVASL
jgi:bifunctional oligoribonuclease and PAP phosphatase NrnA